MAATFRTRPWQLAPLACPGYASALHNITPGLLAHTQHIRHVGTRAPSKRLHPNFRASIKQTAKQQNFQEATTSLTDSMKTEQSVLSPTESAVLAPRTLIPIPLSRNSQMNLSSTLYYYKEILMQRMVDRAGIFSQTWRLKRGRFWTRATFRAERKGIIETALELHAEMSRCLASGSKEDLERLGTICVPKLRRSLIAAVKSRPPGKSYEWELVKMYGSPPSVSWLPRFFSWPRLVDHKWSDIDVGYTQSFRQAVVGIKSRQRLTELDAEGMVVGSKEMELMEYIVLWRSIDKVNLTQSDWLIYGTVKETSLKELKREKTDMQTMSDLMSEQKIREARKKTGVA